MEVIKTTKGMPQLFLDGDLYTKSKTSPNGHKFYWICVRRAYGCRGSLTTTSEYQDPRRGVEHNHFPNNLSLEMAKARLTMKNRARQGEKSCKVYKEVCAAASEDLQDFLPSASVCARTMRKARSATHPTEVKKLADLTFEGDWLTTGGTNPEQFLQADNGRHSEERIVLFATRGQLELLSSATEWFVDGNFGMSPELFMQLYIIRVPLDETAVTALYILLERKTQATYEEMLDMLLDRLGELQLGHSVQRVVLDFELAMINALRIKLGNALSFGACFFHLTQSTYRKIGNLGLTILYKEDDEFALFASKIDALALLPVADVKRGMAHLKSICDERGEGLLKYFDETYVNGKARRNGRCLAPQFPPELWNQHSATIHGEARTNNLAEGWNSMFKTMIGHKHPTVWNLIKNLRLDAAEVTKSVRQAELGDPPRARKQKAIRAALHRRQKNLCEDYLCGRLPLPQFLTQIAKNLRNKDLN